MIHVVRLLCKSSCCHGNCIYSRFLTIRMCHIRTWYSCRTFFCMILNAELSTQIFRFIIDILRVFMAYLKSTSNLLSYSFSMCDWLWNSILENSLKSFICDRFASKLLEHIEEMFPMHYMHGDMFSMFKFSTTH